MENPSAAPVEAPREIKPETGLDVQQERVATVTGDIGGVVGGIPGGVPEAPPPPPPPPAPVRVGGNIQAPKKVKDVNPTYPPIAQSARVQGVVILEATIGPNGKIKAEVFAKIGEKGIGARITTDGDNKNITQILVLGGKKKKDAK